MILETEVSRAWNELKAKTDRGECANPDHSIITRDELFEFMKRTAPAVTPARTTGPRAVVLDANGAPILPAPLTQQFEGERRNQYALDRHMAVMALDPDQWRVFSLRWGLTPPPGGWENAEAITNVMHAVRLGVRSVPYFEKHLSAVFLSSKGIKLPPPMRLLDGVLVGHDTDDSLTG
jgi:hypothetical protein